MRGRDGGGRESTNKVRVTNKVTAHVSIVSQRVFTDCCTAASSVVTWSQKACVSQS